MLKKMQSPPLHSTGTKCFTRIKNVPSEQKLKFVQLDQIVPLEQIVSLEQNMSDIYEETHEVITWRKYNIYVTYEKSKSIDLSVWNKEKWN